MTETTKSKKEKKASNAPEITQIKEQLDSAFDEWSGNTVSSVQTKSGGNAKIAINGKQYYKYKLEGLNLGEVYSQYKEESPLGDKCLL